MKRFPLLAAAAVLLLGIATQAAADAVIVAPADMKDGETKTYTDDGKTITITRNGDTTHIKIGGAGETKSITITKEDDGTIRIDRDGKLRGLHERGFVWSPDRQKIVIDGVPLQEFATRFQQFPRASAQTWFVCPKDKTMLRVPDEKGDETFKCPVDGTTMEKRKARGFSFHFDNDFFENEDL